MRFGRSLNALAAGLTFAMFGPCAMADEGASAVLKDRTIGYALSDEHWAIYQSADGKTECPQGFNDGPREQFKALFPDDGSKRTLADTALAREREVWFPKTTREPYPFFEATGKIAIGLDLDGKIGPNDFAGPEGEKGIDNQLYRAIGCISNYRGPDGTLFHFTNAYMQRHNYNRMLIELTGVDSLVNDGDVMVTTYRGLDSLLTDATGQDSLPGGSQHVDGRWGQSFVQHFRGKIENGVLMTEPADLIKPATAAFEDTTVQIIKGLRFHLKLTPDRAEGLMAGYTDVENFYYQLNEAWSTHLQSYGQLASPSLYRAMRRLADGYPDPKTGEMTAISSALEVKFTQVFVQHPPGQTAAVEAQKKDAW